MTRSALVFALAFIASANAKADEVLLSCWGTVARIQQGKQVNPVGERYSIAVAVDVAKRTLTIDRGKWSITGDGSGEAIVSMDPDKGSITLNRITGQMSAHFYEDGLLKFYGECKPEQKLF